MSPANYTIIKTNTPLRLQYQINGFVVPIVSPTATKRCKPNELLPEQSFLGNDNADPILKLLCAGVHTLEGKGK